LPLLQSLASLPAGEGPPGVLVEAGLNGAVAPNAGEDAAEPPPSSFRHDLPAVKSNQPIWPWIVVAASCLFWGDVFVRRVQVDLAWLPPALAKLRDRVLRRERQSAPVEMMSRLRSRKSEIADRIANQRAAAARFEDERPRDRPPDEAAPVAAVLVDAAPTRPMPKAKPVEETQQPASYTERLLQAKKEAQRRPGGNDPRQK
jgi:hypothetical protein